MTVRTERTNKTDRTNKRTSTNGEEWESMVECGKFEGVRESMDDGGIREFLADREVG